LRFSPVVRSSRSPSVYAVADGLSLGDTLRLFGCRARS
jgi:hypothetical protein